MRCRDAIYRDGSESRFGLGLLELERRCVRAFDVQLMHGGVLKSLFSLTIAQVFSSIVTVTLRKAT